MSTQCISSHLMTYLTDFRNPSEKEIQKVRENNQSDQVRVSYLKLAAAEIGYGLIAVASLVEMVAYPIIGLATIKYLACIDMCLSKKSVCEICALTALGSVAAVMCVAEPRFLLFLLPAPICFGILRKLSEEPLTRDNFRHVAVDSIMRPLFINLPRNCIHTFKNAVRNLYHNLYSSTIFNNPLSVEQRKEIFLKCKEEDTLRRIDMRLESLHETFDKLGIPRVRTSLENA